MKRPSLALLQHGEWLTAAACAAAPAVGVGFIASAFCTCTVSWTSGDLCSSS